LSEQERAYPPDAGDEQAFRELFEDHAEMVYRLSLRMLGNRQEAEDAVQEVFCRLFASLHSFRREAKLSSWIYRVTLNYCLNHQRQKKYARWFSLEWLDDQPEGVRTDENPHQRMEEEERERVLHAAINRLPEGQRSALILFRFEGKSYQEIAEILGCSVAAVESRLFQAKKKLCKMLIPILKDASFE
jgi:RNA polymerase sigma-70 factor (ECF subfamily)